MQYNIVLKVQYSYLTLGYSTILSSRSSTTVWAGRVGAMVGAMVEALAGAMVEALVGSQVEAMAGALGSRSRWPQRSGCGSGSRLGQ